MTTTELCPASDSSAPVQADPPQQPGSPQSLTLYALTDDLSQLLGARAEMLEAQEDTAVVDQAIAEYMTALPKKADAIAHVLGSLESQVALSKVEEERLYARRQRFQACIDALKGYVVNAMSQLPKPTCGSRKIEGSTATLVLKTNGGLVGLEVLDPSLIPDEYCTATVTLPWKHWQQICAGISTSSSEYETLLAKGKLAVDNAAVRAALEEKCWFCDGNGIIEASYDPAFDRETPGGDCSSCGGSGRNGVPGARLLERGSHLEVK